MRVAPRKGLSLGGKVLLIALAATFLVVAAAEAYRLWAIRQDRLALLVQKAERMADVQAVAMSRPMFDYDREVVGVLVEAMAGDPDVVWVSVVGTDGAVFGQLGRDTGEGAGQVVTRRAITYRYNGVDEKVGSLVIGFSSEAADRDVRNSMQFSLGGMAAVLIALSLAITWSVRRITIPLREMTGVLLRLADGDKEVRVTRTDRADEIGDIARAAEVFRQHAVQIERLETAKATEAALRESEERLRLIVDSMPVPVVMTRMADHRILFANRQVRLLLGDEIEPVGTPTRDFYVNPADRDRLLDQMTEKGSIDSFEAQLRRADGST
ncbi:MAG TPA: PAS domain-containing protein, partial [Candidatus Omnitrophota bacterium]|nr:PAS domain-containing protein [Candidatus Omnitrophota bacterium]